MYFMRRILLIIQSFLLLNICYSEELTNAIDKIIYSHIGMQDHPVWATQISYRDLGSYTVPGTNSTNKVFYYGLRWRDSIMGPVFSYKINKNCYDEFKKSIEEYPQKVLSSDSLLNSNQFGTMCVSIIENGKITRWYFKRYYIIKLFDVQMPILEADSSASEFYDRIKSLREWFCNSKL